MVQGAGHRLPRGTSQVLTARPQLGAELAVARCQAQQPETRMAPGQKTEGEDLLFLGGFGLKAGKMEVLEVLELI